MITAKLARIRMESPAMIPYTGRKNRESNQESSESGSESPESDSFFMVILTKKMKFFVDSGK